MSVEAPSASLSESESEHDDAGDDEDDDEPDELDDEEEEEEEEEEADAGADNGEAGAECIDVGIGLCPPTSGGGCPDTPNDGSSSKFIMPAMSSSNPSCLRTILCNTYHVACHQTIIKQHPLCIVSAMSITE